MPKFKVASRTADEMVLAKQTLDDTFSIVRGKGGVINRKAVRELEENKWEIAELILQLLNDDIANSDPTPFLVDVTDGDIRDNYAFQRVESDLRVVSRAHGTSPLSQRITFKEFPMYTSGKEINVAVNLVEVASGRITPSMISELMALAISRYRISSILDALDAGVPNDPDNTGVAGYTLRYGSFTQGNLDKAIDGMQDDNDSPTIFGRSIVLNPTIRGFTGWSADTQRELEVRGAIGLYHNANVVTLVDRKSKVTGDHLFRKDRVYVAGGTKGALYMTKDLSFLDYVNVDPKNDVFEVGTRLEDGLLVHDPARYRIIEA